MNNSITPRMISLIRDFPLDADKNIPSGTTGFVVTEDYIKQSSFSTDDHEKLFLDAYQAKSLGYLYVHFVNYGKCRSVRPDYISSLSL